MLTNVSKTCIRFSNECGWCSIVHNFSVKVLVKIKFCQHSFGLLMTRVPYLMNYKKLNPYRCKVRIRGIIRKPANVLTNSTWVKTLIAQWPSEVMWLVHFHQYIYNLHHLWMFIDKKAMDVQLSAVGSQSNSQQLTLMNSNCYKQYLLCNFVHIYNVVSS